MCVVGQWVSNYGRGRCLQRLSSTTLRRRLLGWTGPPRPSGPGCPRGSCWPSGCHDEAARRLDRVHPSPARPGPCRGDGDGISNVYNPADAIFTAASYLCRNGGGKGGDLSRAVFGYNHADWYVTKVLAIASTYEAATAAPWGGGPAAPPNHDVAAIAIRFAYNQLGKPYVWGAEGDNFHDCSGLMQRAYKEAGVQLPRTSREQWYAGARVLDPGDLQPGDLVFGANKLSDPSTIYHVGMYIGAGNMIVAPYTGAVVRIQPMIRNDYIGRQAHRRRLTTPGQHRHGRPCA